MSSQKYHILTLESPTNVKQHNLHIRLGQRHFLFPSRSKLSSFTAPADFRRLRLLCTTSTARRISWSCHSRESSELSSPRTSSRAVPRVPVFCATPVASFVSLSGAAGANERTGRTCQPSYSPTGRITMATNLDWGSSQTMAGSLGTHQGSGERARGRRGKEKKLKKKSFLQLRC